MAERSNEEWGRVAVSLPGWRWAPGMLDASRGQRVLATGRGSAITAVFPPRSPCRWPRWPDVDDPATAGCLLALLGSETDSLMLLPNEAGLFEWYDGKDWQEESLPLGRACIAAAESIGHWPGGMT